MERIAEKQPDDFASATGVSWTPHKLWRCSICWILPSRWSMWISTSSRFARQGRMMTMRRVYTVFRVGGEKSGLRSTTLFRSHRWAQFMDVDYEKMNLSNCFGFPAGQVEVKYCHLIYKVSMLFAFQAPLLPCLPPKIQLRALGQDDDALLVPIYVGAISSKYVGEDRVSAVGCLIQKILSIKVTRKLGTWTFTEPFINV